MFLSVENRDFALNSLPPSTLCEYVRLNSLLGSRLRDLHLLDFRYTI